MRRALAALLLGACGAAAPDPAEAISDARARAMFTLRCAGCHQLDGAGHPQFGVPSMRDKLGYFLGSAAGRAFLVQAPGARNAALSDAELTALTNWALRNFAGASLPADFTPYSTREVSQARANPPRDVAAARSAFLQELRAGGRLPEPVWQELTQ